MKITDLLFQDREKERVKRESEEAKRREAEEAEAAVRSAQERQEKIRQAKIDLAARVQPEPDASHEDVTRILIKVNRNSKKEKKVCKTTAICCMHNYATSKFPSKRYKS